MTGALSPGAPVMKTPGDLRVLVRVNKIWCVKGAMNPLSESQIEPEKLTCFMVYDVQK